MKKKILFLFLFGLISICCSFVMMSLHTNAKTIQQNQSNVQFVEQQETKPQCFHNERKKILAQRPTVKNDGLEAELCKYCGKLLNTNVVERLHSFVTQDDILQYATPEESGVKLSICEFCGEERIEEYNYERRFEDYLYVPGIIDAELYLGNFTQYDVDNHDIVYAYAKNCNIILGHNTRSLEKLYLLEIGDEFFVSTNGMLEKFKVIASERSTDVGNDIIGENGHRLFQDANNPNYLRMYTCYKKPQYGEDSRWLVIAEKV